LTDSKRHTVNIQKQTLALTLFIIPFENPTGAEKIKKTAAYMVMGANAEGILLNCQIIVVHTYSASYTTSSVSK